MDCKKILMTLVICIAVICNICVWSYKKEQSTDLQYSSNYVAGDDIKIVSMYELIFAN